MVGSATLMALVLVLASAFAHATWNLLLKRAQRQEVFVWWLSAAGAVGAAPVAIVLAFTTEFAAVGLWFVVASSLVHICYFLSFCLLYTSPSPRDLSTSRMPSSA